ncbi:MAG: dCTP deaminase [archaeon]
MIIGVTGTLGAGKGVVVDYLKSRGFKHYSVRDFLSEEILKRGLGLNKANMVLVDNDLREKFGAGFVVDELCKRAERDGGDCVIESVRCPGEVEALRKRGDFILFAVDADVETRYARIVERGGVTDAVSFDEFVADEQREMMSDDASRQNLKRCIEMADYVFKNDWTIAELNKKVEKVFGKIIRKSERMDESGIFCSGILSDVQIKRRVASGEIKIVPYDEGCVQPASYDLHLDGRFKIFRSYVTEAIDARNPSKDLMEDVDLGGRDFFVLHPGSFVLGLVKEVTSVDKRHAGRLEGKNSLAKLGLIVLPGFLHPGNSFQLTLELFNASPLPIKLYPGMKIAQIIFEGLGEGCV